MLKCKNMQVSARHCLLHTQAHLDGGGVKGEDFEWVNVGVAKEFYYFTGDCKTRRLFLLCGIASERLADFGKKISLSTVFWIAGDVVNEIIFSVVNKMLIEIMIGTDSIAT